MSFDWIGAKQFSFNTLLLMDRWIFNTIARNRNQEFKNNLAVALAGNPAVHWYIVNKCPEQQKYYDTLVSTAQGNISVDQDGDTWVIDHSQRATTRKVIQFNSDYRYADGWTGRYLRRLFIQNGFEEVRISSLAPLRHGKRLLSSYDGSADCAIRCRARCHF